MNFNNILQQAQKMQKELTKKISDFEAKTFDYSYQNDSIKITIQGNLKIKSIKINEILIDSSDKQMLEEMVAEAINFAIDNVLSEKEKLTPKSFGGLPGLF